MMCECNSVNCITLWKLTSFLCNTSVPQSAWSIFLYCEPLSKRQGSDFQLQNCNSWEKSIGIVYSQIASWWPSEDAVSILKNWWGNKMCSGNARKGTTLNWELVSCLQHYKMSIRMWFKGEYWCLIKFTFTNQSEVQGCQPSWLAHRPARNNWEGKESWFIRWEACTRIKCNNVHFYAPKLPETD